MRESLSALALYSTGSRGEALVALNGTTWMKPHGLTVGFSWDRLPAGWGGLLLALRGRGLEAGPLR